MPNSWQPKNDENGNLLSGKRGKHTNANKVFSTKSLNRHSVYFMEQSVWKRRSVRKRRFRQRRPKLKRNANHQRKKPRRLRERHRKSGPLSLPPPGRATPKRSKKVSGKMQSILPEVKSHRILQISSRLLLWILRRPYCTSPSRMTTWIWSSGLTLTVSRFSGSQVPSLIYLIRRRS